MAPIAVGCQLTWHSAASRIFSTSTRASAVRDTSPRLKARCATCTFAMSVDQAPGGRGVLPRTSPGAHPRSGRRTDWRFVHGVLVARGEEGLLLVGVEVRL